MQIASSTPDPSCVSAAAAKQSRQRREVAVIIPTKDRPDFLQEAIASALAQTHSPIEVVVVDDGSTPAVDSAELTARHGPTVSVLRNDVSRGLAYSRNRGVEEARAEYVIHLDDDDLLAPDTIEQCLGVLERFPDVDWVMFAAVGFGPRAEHFNRVQPAGVDRLIELAAGQAAGGDTVLFDRRLFPALLQTVPAAFQRAMLSKDTWARVSQLRWLAYCQAESLPDAESAKVRITGPLRDSEWARYAAIVCRRFALVNRPLYLARCEGQGYSSQPSSQQLHADQSLQMLKVLYRAASTVPAVGEWRPQIREAMARAYFDFAYSRSAAGDHRAAWAHLVRAFSTQAQWRQVRLAARILFHALRPAGGQQAQ